VGESAVLEEGRQGGREGGREEFVFMCSRQGKKKQKRTRSKKEEKKCSVHLYRENNRKKTGLET